jgi:protein-disulfide isomerase
MTVSERRWTSSETMLALSILAIIGSPLWALSHSQPMPQLSQPHPAAALPTTVSLESAQLLGARDAPVVLVEFADFQCQFCAEFALETLPALQQRYVQTGRLLIAFMHLPSPMRQYSLLAAQTAECAGGPREFWAMHEALFRHHAQLNPDLIRGLAPANGVKVVGPGGLDECLTRDARVRTVIADHAAAAYAMEIRSTPWFLLGRQEENRDLRIDSSITGARPLKEFESAIEALLTPRVR